MNRNVAEGQVWGKRGMLILWCMWNHPRDISGRRQGNLELRGELGLKVESQSLSGQASGFRDSVFL